MVAAGAGSTDFGRLAVRPFEAGRRGVAGWGGGSTSPSSAASAVAVSSATTRSTSTNCWRSAPSHESREAIQRQSGSRPAPSSYSATRSASAVTSRSTARALATRPAMPARRPCARSGSLASASRSSSEALSAAFALREPSGDSSPPENGTSRAALQAPRRCCCPRPPRCAVRPPRSMNSSVLLGHPRHGWRTGGMQGLQMRQWSRMM
jgi:hypothetical protein